MHSSANGHAISLAATVTASQQVVEYPTPVVLAEEAVLLTWRVHRLRRNPRLLPLVALAYGIGLFFWLHLFPHPLTLILPLGALTSSMAEYLFPISYRLTTRGAYANCFLSRLYLAWPEVKRARYGSDGIYLSPLLLPSRLDTFRGLRLCFAEGNQEAVLQTVRRCRCDFGAPEVARK